MNREDDRDMQRRIYFSIGRYVCIVYLFKSEIMLMGMCVCVCKREDKHTCGCKKDNE